MSGTRMIPSFSLGYVAKGQAALLKAQKSDSELQRIEREQAEEVLTMQYDATTANAKGIINSANAEAKSDELDAINYGVQAGTNLGQVGHTFYDTYKMNGELSENSTKQKQLEEFDKEFQATKPASQKLTNASERQQQAQFTKQQEQRFQELKNGEGELQLKNANSDRVVLKHIKADEQARGNLSKHINKTRESLIQQENSTVTKFQAAITRHGLYYTIAQNATQTGVAAAKMAPARDRGYGQATSALAQNAEQNANTSINTYMQDAATFDQQAAQINRAREALANNGQG